MKLIVGLGNPGKKYESNRHNFGYMIADSFVDQNGGNWSKSMDLMCFYCKSEDWVVIKPTTFMNESGQSVKAVANFYKISNRDVLVVLDDLDLPMGKIRLSFNGSAAGHHGVESVIEALGTPDIARLKIGIGRPRVGDGAGYVLSDFLPEEKKLLGEIIDKSLEAVFSYLEDGVMATMNRFN